MRKIYKHPIQVYLSDDENLELQLYCDSNGVKKSDVLRDAMSAFFRQQNETASTSNGNRFTEIAA
jgi:hypothetical protein